MDWLWMLEKEEMTDEVARYRLALTKILLACLDENAYDPRTIIEDVRQITVEALDAAPDQAASLEA